MVLNKIPYGAFEIYFMGIRLFSKRLSKTWPDVEEFVTYFKKVFEAYKNGEDIIKYEYRPFMLTAFKKINRP